MPRSTNVRELCRSGASVATSTSGSARCSPNSRHRSLVSLALVDEAQAIHRLAGPNGRRRDSTARHALHSASVARMPLPADRTSTAVRARPRSYGAVVTQLVTQALDG
jgi:hypothetical protein